MEPTHILEGYVSPSELAEQLKCSKRTVQRMMQRREVAFAYLGSKRIIDVEGTRALLKAQVKAGGRK